MRTKLLRDLGNRRAAGRGELTRNGIRIHHRCAQLAQHHCYRTFAAANAAS
jgi:hypothetical protein